jgi:hypothetical protein
VYEEFSRQAYIVIAHKRGMFILAPQLLINGPKTDHFALLSPYLVSVGVSFSNEPLDRSRQAGSFLLPVRRLRVAL